ncbi:hypothetical protein JYQ62_26050 [Nostoc sp. UHCC 0702]|nr:hypothetical protein JYQ62_26050 [Nostoc sp. UHCC 0702]
MFALISYTKNFGILVAQALGVGIPVLFTPGIVQQKQLVYVPELDVLALVPIIYT